MNLNFPNQRNAASQVIIYFISIVDINLNLSFLTTIKEI